jgi:hypothetical protein
MKKRLMSVILCMSVVSVAVSQNAPAPVIIYVSAILGPDKSNTNGSDAYDTWVNNTVTQMYQAGTPLQHLSQLSDDLGHVLETAYVSQPSNLASNTVWFAVHVVATDPAYKFVPGQLLFQGWSSDAAHSLAKTNTFSDPTFIYAPSSKGIAWGAGGPRVNDSFASGYWNATPVNELIFIGAESKHFVYSSLADYTNIDDYIRSFKDFQLTGTWEFMDVASNVLVHASTTLHFSGMPAPGILSAVNDSPTNVTVSVLSAGTNDSWILEQASTVDSSVWIDVATVNWLDVLRYSTLLGPTEFWRMVLQ